MREHIDYLSQIQPVVEKVEARKQDILDIAINDHLPHFAASDTRIAVRFALSTLDDIRQGHNPHYEPLLREKAKELGIDLDLAA